MTGQGEKECPGPGKHGVRHSYGGAVLVEMEKRLLGLYILVDR